MARRRSVGVYMGESVPARKGQYAMLRTPPQEPTMVEAQFEDETGGETWHTFAREDFVVVRSVASTRVIHTALKRLREKEA